MSRSGEGSTGDIGQKGLDGTGIEHRTNGAQQSYTSFNNIPPDPQLQEKIIRQVEFYFSEDNLQHDKYLQQQLSKDELGEGWVAIKAIAALPKMKQLTKDTTVVREALKRSSVLQVSSDGASVRRRFTYGGQSLMNPPQQSSTPFAAPIPAPMQQPAASEPPSPTKGAPVAAVEGEAEEGETYEEKTMIYCTHVPKGLDRQAVMQLFSVCGNVRRLDLPIDKKTGEIRGIAFVQYDNPEQVQRALKYFGHGTNPHKIRSYPYKDPKKNKSKDTKEKGTPATLERDHATSTDAHAAGFAKRSKEALAEAFNDYKEKAERKLRSNSIGYTPQPQQWEPDPTQASLRPKLKGISEELPTIVPIRQPIGPSGGKGFTSRATVIYRLEEGSSPAEGK